MSQPDASIHMSSKADVVEAAPPTGGRRLAVTAGLLALATVLGGVVGYRLAGHPTTPVRDDLALAVTPLSATIAPTGKHCSQQRGRQLQLGVEIVNRSAYPVMVQEFAATLPLGGMQVVDAAWGTCGELTPQPSRTLQTLPAGATAWMSAVFDVFEACPAAVPVSFTVLAADDVDTAAIDTGGFADLGEVPYSGCLTPSP
jgi:hypothetical protein